MDDTESGNKFFENYDDKNHPVLPKEAFNLELLNSEHFRYNPILTFGRTFKNLDGGYGWKQLIQKFEFILRSIKFRNAKMYLETEIMGNYEFYWKYNHESNTENKLLFKAGKYSMFGTEILEENRKFPFDTEYPIKYDKEVLDGFNSIVNQLNEIELKTKYVFQKPYEHNFIGHDGIRLILTKLQLEGLIEWGYEKKENNYALYIIRKGVLNQMNNAV